MQSLNLRSPAWFELSRPAYVIVLVLIATVIGIGAATVGREQTSIAAKANCVALQESEQRLACYDNAFHRAAAQPAKGANAPLLR
jgi:hypothetical protein